MGTMYSGLGGSAGYGENTFSTTAKAAGTNDDGAVLVDVTSVFGSGINFYGTSYSSIYINSNGVISFGAPLTAYQTSNYGAVTTPNMAVFWGDVNINSGGEIYWDIDPTTGTITITWDSVAPYSGTGTNSFQVRLTDTGGGNFTVEYIYEDIQWAGGGGGDLADVGFSDGGANDTILDGSNNSTKLLDYETNDFGDGANGTWTQAFVGGVPISPDGIVSGTAGNDTIDATYSDIDGDVVDGGDGTGVLGNEDVIHAGAGDDTVAAGDEADLVYGGDGSDTIDGGAGDDILYGDNNATLPAATTENLHWADEGPDGASIAAGFTQTTGTMDVSVSFASTGNNLPEFTVETTDTVYVEGGESYDPNSNLLLFGNGDGPTSSTTIDFAASTGSGMSDAVENVSFRINDIDWGDLNHTDIVTINAYDADGNPVTVSISLGGGDTLSGNTITAEAVAENFDQVGGSALISIAGPVSQIEIVYANGQGGTQGIWVTDLYFDTIPAPLTGGDDTLTGGLGADMMYGEAGNDIFYVAEGDTAEGGDGDDTFNLVDLGEPGSSTITITGGEGSETTGDTLNFGGLIGNLGQVTITNADDANGGLTGFATLADGTVVNFSEIETLIVCYAKGTQILTDRGERPIETLRPGDLVLTADDGLQTVEWIGKRTVLGIGNNAPIRFAPGVLGASRALTVSPQHRMLMQGADIEMLFGMSEVFAPAKALVDGQGVTHHPVAEVTWYHLLLPRHAVIFANGVASESFFPAEQALCALDQAARADLLVQRPDLRARLANYGATARPCLSTKEASLIRAHYRTALAAAA